MQTSGRQTDPAASACKPSHHSFLSFPYNYYNIFFFFKCHPSLCRLNSHCKATNQWLITAKCLSPSSLNSNGANCRGQLTSSSKWCRKSSTCTKKKNNPTPPDGDQVGWCARLHDTKQQEAAPSVHIASVISPCELAVHRAACYTYKTLHL